MTDKLTKNQRAEDDVNTMLKEIGALPKDAESDNHNQPRTGATGGPTYEARRTTDESSGDGHMERATAAASGNSTKRKNPSDEVNGEGAARASDAKKKKPDAVNRAIYVTGIPKDATLEKIEYEFKHFCGLIDVGADGKKRVKLYHDEHGNFKGEALIVFLRPESIASALSLMNDHYIWYGAPEKLHIQEADFSYKKEQDGSTVATQLSRDERKAIDYKRAELERARTAWDSDEEAEPIKPVQNKHAKIVIVKHLFTKAELDNDPEFIADIKDDLIMSNSTHGRVVTSVQVWDLEPEGIVSVKFKTVDDAAAFLAATHNRFLPGVEGVSKDRYMTAELATDKPRFRKSRKDEAAQSDSD